MATSSTARAAAHAEATQRFQQAFRDALAQRTDERPIRLAKRTSNLFRFDAAQRQGIDASELSGIVEVDPHQRRAVVAGMTTYEELVAATLPHRLMPTVVPQLKTITVGGAISGLGIEATSLRYGLPHEGVVELEVLAPNGELLRVGPGQHNELFAAFPNSYGTLGYGVTATIELIPVAPFVHVRHHRFSDLDVAAAAIGELADDPPMFVDGVMFSPDEVYLSVGEWAQSAHTTASRYLKQGVYYQSLRKRSEDLLTTRDYLWRWDPDWFWCSKPFGVQNKLIRSMWPQSYLRSDVYHRLVSMDQRLGISRRIDSLRGRRPTELVIQDVEVPVAELASFLRAFTDTVGISPAWICPLRTRSEWTLYPLQPKETYVNIGFWSGVESHPSDPYYYNKRVEELVAAHHGHKSLYSTVHYSESEFWRHYNGPRYRAVKQQYDPDNALGDLYHKVGGSTK